MAKAENCDETCSNYKDCKADGATEMFVQGATCPDRHKPEPVAKKKKAKKRKKRTNTATVIGKLGSKELSENTGPVVDLSEPEPIAEPTQVCITNRRKRLKNMFLADAVRDENDRDFLNKEIGQRKYKGKLKTITTIKHYDVIDGDWVTSFIIDLKE